MNILLPVGKLLKRSQRIYTWIRKITCYLSTVEPGFLKTREKKKHWFLKEFLLNTLACNCRCQQRDLQLQCNLNFFMKIWCCPAESLLPPFFFDDRFLGKEEFHFYLNLKHQSVSLTLTVLLKMENWKRTGRINHISCECIWLSSTMALTGNCIVGYVLWGNHMNGYSVQCKSSCNIQ